jgi:serine/threonine-protein kinase
VHAAAQYLSPEQVRGESVDARSDVYATGCVLYELITGTPPFTGDSPVAITHLQVREPPSRARPGVGREIDAIVVTALSKNPLNRYQSSAQMRSDLLRALSGQAVQAAQPGLSHPGGERTGLITAPPWWGVAGSPALLAPPAPADFGRDRESKDRVGRHRGGVSAGVGAVCLALAAALWLTLRVVTAPPPAPLVAVPDLSGMPLSQVTAVLQADLLTLGAVTPTASSPSDKDRVVDQRPSGQTDVTRDTAVSVDIGTGVPPVT